MGMSIGDVRPSALLLLLLLLLRHTLGDKM